MKNKFSYLNFLLNITVICLLTGILSEPVNGQTLQNGCDEARFGIDADTRASISYFGNVAAQSTTTDDWFKGIGQTGIGVLDTTGGWMIHNAIQNEENTVWLKGMAYPTNVVINGVRLHDATYARDYYGGSGATDFTSFVNASKNGEDPADWNTGPHNVLGKNDLIDCYAHLRRDGLEIDDHLWMYLGFSRIANTGSSYFDAEMYVESMDYDPVNGFPSGGPDDGHTAWKFDVAGNIIQVGDLVTTCEFSTTNAPVLGLRVWVSRYDFLNTDPATFIFGAEFDGDGNGAVYGYADIEIPPNSLYGCGLGNPDYSVGPPWGTLNTSGVYSAFYEANQFVEVGLDLTIFGVDPLVLYEEDGSNMCKLPFSNIIFKTRTSSSFSAQLKDFAGPFPFHYTTDLPVDIVGADTLNCFQPIIELSVQDTFPGSFYSWYTEDGNIITDSTQFQISINEPGTYIVNVTFSQNCEGSKDTIVIVDNTNNQAGADISYEVAYGCRVATHLTALPNGYDYFWTGPGAFTANTQDVFVPTEGMYYLEVLNSTTGCVAFDSIYVMGSPCQDDIPDTISTTLMLDTIAPQFTLPGNITIDCNSDPFDLSITGDITDETDNCDTTVGEATFTDIISENYPCSGSALLQRLWRLTDACGNVTLQTQIITIVDTSPPSFTVPENITLSCEDDITNLLLTGTPINLGDDCDSGTVEVSYSDATQNGNCNGGLVIIRTWTAMDDCGNTTTAQQTIALIDTALPLFTAPQNISIECDEDPYNLSLTGDVFNEWDNCDSNIGEAVYVDVVVPNDPCVGTSTINRTWSLTDDCGNVTTAIQVITMEDTTPPILFLANANQPYVECDTIIPLPQVGGELIIFDNCDDDVTIVFEESIISSGCPDKYTIRRVWVATDACNNQDSIIQEFQVQDTENPIVIVLPSDVTLECGETIPDGDVVVDDNCSDQVSFSFVENILPGNCENGFVVERIWNWIDNCGNVETHTQFITVEDLTAPVFTPPDDIIIDCSKDPNDLALTGGVTNASDICDADLEATYVDNVTTGFPCNGATLIIRTWSLEDDCGNTTSHVQQILMEDTSPPVFTVPADIVISCDLDPYDLTFTGDVTDESDNCDTTIGAAIYTDSISLESTCDGQSLIYRFWALADACGNETTLVQLITVVDITPPTMTLPDDITLNCTDDPYDLNLTGQINNLGDNCSSGVLNGLYTDSLVVSDVCGHNVIIYRKWTIEDACGNDTTEVQIITLQDNVPPVFTAPIGVTLECGQDPNDLMVTGQVDFASDNCDATLAEATYTDQINNENICNGGLVIDRIWMVADACGNSSTALQQIIVEDTTPPLFTAPVDIVISCDSNADDLSITGDVIDESDGCDQNIGQATYTDEVSTLGVCTGSTTITRTWMLADACGNVTTDIQTIYLEDATPPVFSSPANITLECDQNPYDLSVTGDVVNEFDNCTSNIGEATFSDSIWIDSASCMQSVIILRTWLLVDGCGNDAVAVQEITIQDTTPPVFLHVPTDTTVNCDGVPPAIEQLATIDNCGANIEVTFTEMENESSCEGTHFLLRTWAATDPCGNVSTATQQITVINCNTGVGISEIEANICSGEEYIFNGTAYSETGVYTTSLTGFNGCDSLVQLTLTESPAIQENIEAVICNGDTYLFGDSVYTESGVYAQTIPSISGCDSTVQLTLTVKDLYQIDQEVFLCAGEEIIIGGNIVNTNGTYVDSLFSDTGCDSIMIYYVQVLLPILNSKEVILCAGEGLMVNNIYQTTPGVYMDTLAALSGCDSIVSISLTFHPDLSYTEEVNICEGDNYMFFGSEYTEAGTYVANWTAPNGCENTVTLLLSVSNLLSDTLTVSICEGASYLFEGNELTIAGEYSHTYSTSTCDSLVVLNLNVIPPVATTLLDTICTGEPYLFVGDLLTSSGVYNATFNTSIGCDSTVVLFLVIQDAETYSQQLSICEGDSIYVGGAFQFNSGTYTDTYTSSGAYCDSVVQTTLVVHSDAIEHMESYTICQGDSLYLFDDYYTKDTTVSMAYNTFGGCDSIVTKTLYILPVVELLVEDYEICLGEEVTLSVFGADEISWSPADGLSCIDCATPEANPTMTTTYVVTAESCLGEEVSAEVTVVVNYPPSIRIISENDESVTLGDTVAFRAEVNDPFAVINWSDSEGNTICENCNTAEVEPYYGVSYIATAVNQEGCVDQEEIRFNIRDGCVEGVLEIPNFITPNGDGHNDKFQIRYSNFSEVSVLRVYNRWGELVFQTTEVETEFWDGTFRGKSLNPDVYIYYLEGYCLNGDWFIEKGNVTILK